MIVSIAMKNIILSLVITLLLTACNGGNSTAAKGITRPQQGTINIGEQLDRLEHANTSLPKLTISSDALYHELTNKLAQKDWRDANSILLLLHYMQITSIREASIRGSKTVAMTVKAIYGYEIDKIIPLLKKYVYPDDVIDFQITRIFSFMHRILSSHLDPNDYQLIKEMYLFFECIQKYCWFTHNFHEYPKKLSDFFKADERPPSIFLKDNKLIWRNHEYSYILSLDEFPQSVVDILNQKFIFKNKQKINSNLEELGFNDISPAELQDVLIFFPEVKQLYLSNCDIDFAKFHLPDSINTLLVDDSSVFNLKKICGKSHIFYLSLSHCKIDDFSALSDFENLDTLILNDTKFRAIHSLQKLTKLTRLEANNTDVEYLYNIRELHALKVLWLKNTPLKDLSGVNDLQKLENLNISGSQVKSVSALSKLQNLQYLTIFNIPVSHSEIQKLRAEHPHMIIVSSYH